MMDEGSGSKKHNLIAKEVEKIVGKAKEEAYQKGYEAAKAESRSQEKKSS